MSEKVTLPKEVAEAIGHYREKGMSNASIIATAVTYGSTVGKGGALVSFVLETVGNSDLLMSALVNGYEVEQTPEDRLRDYYDRLDKRPLSETPPGWYTACGVRNTLDILGIKIEGVNA